MHRTARCNAAAGNRSKCDGGNPACSVLAPDGFIICLDLGNGRERWDFNVTPIGGEDVTTCKGALFNYQFTFSQPGAKVLGFAEADHVNRTYYSNSHGWPDYFWGDITNTGAPPLVVH